MRDVRDIEIVERFKAGAICSQLARDFSVSTSRIGQILQKNGLSAFDGGQHKRKLDRLKIQKSRRDARSQKFYGCSHEDYLRLSSYRKAFAKQKRNAALRGIEFKLSLVEWCELWIKSGKYSQRGKGIGKFVMARKGDDGAYEIGNVMIISAVENNHDGCIVGLKNSGKKHPDKYYP